MEIAEIFVSCKKEAHYSKELTLPFPVLLRVISGELRIVGAAQSHSFFAGDTALLPRNQLGRMSKLPLDGQPCVTITIIFQEERLRQYYTANLINPAVLYQPALRSFKEHPLLKSLFNSLMPYFELKDALPKDIAKFKVEEAIRVLRAIDPRVDQLLANFGKPGKIDLVKYMEENYLFNLPLEKFAYLTGRSLTIFKKDFNQAFGTTPSKWLTKKRLERAHYLISEQKRKPAEIHFEIGFENLSHFSSAFKKQFGYNPTSLLRS